MAAGMKLQKFPDWAPKTVIAEWEKKLAEAEYWENKSPTLPPDTEEVDLLFRLLTYPEMKNVWEKLQRHTIKPELFSSMVQLASAYLDIKPHNLTPREHKKWLADVKSAAQKLADLVEFSEYDRIFQERYYVKRQKYMLSCIIAHSSDIWRLEFDEEQWSQTQPSYESWPDLLPSLLSQALREITILESDSDIGTLGVKRDERVKLDKPNHPNAKRSYFIRKLTQLLRKETGKPLREIVTITASIVFDDPTLTERQIMRIAP